MPDQTAYARPDKLYSDNHIKAVYTYYIILNSCGLQHSNHSPVIIMI